MQQKKYIKGIDRMEAGHSIPVVNNERWKNLT